MDSFLDVLNARNDDLEQDLKNPHVVPQDLNGNEKRLSQGTVIRGGRMNRKLWPVSVPAHRDELQLGALLMIS